MIQNVNVNRVIQNTSYFCAICGAEHESIEARHACETKCIKERKEAEELMKKQKLEEEKNARKEEIDTLYALLNEKIKSYVKDYGSIKMNRAVKYDGNFPTLSDLFNFWSF